MKSNESSAKHSPSRRSFLKGSSAFGAGFLAPLPTWAKPEGANGEPRIAVVGVRGKGNGHLKHLLKMEGVRVAAVCDPDQAILDQRLTEAREKQPGVKGFRDFRELCMDPDVDGVVIATPNHLHTLIALTAIANGKHVYVEKPVSHNLHEGRMLTAAARKHPELMVQHGMQRRSDMGWREATAWLREGHLGKVTCARGVCYKSRKSIGKVSAPKPVPENVDYNLWSGPREIMPLRRESFHYDWHWQWAYGNGEIGNTGPHQMDIARWALGQDAVAPRVISVGGRFGYDDDGTTANTQIAFFDYQPAPLIFEVRGLPEKGLDWRKGMSNFKGVRIGDVIECEGGYIAESKAYDKDGKAMGVKFGITNGGGHMEKWITSIRSGKQDPHCSVENGSVSAALCHMANASHRLGSEVAPEEAKEAMDFSGLMGGAFGRFAEHMERNGVDLEKHQPTLGAWLEIDPATEMYKGEHASAANALAAGEYRHGFGLPKV